MDSEKLEDLKKENQVDNSHLEELISQDITPQMQREVFEVLKESRLFLPIDLGHDALEGIENSKPGDKIDGPSGFNIQFLTDNDGNKAVPLFTSEEMMEKAGARTSVMVIYMQDLANLLKQTDKYSILSINPFTEHDLNMPMEAFLNLFRQEVDEIRHDELRELLKGDLTSMEFKIEIANSTLIVPCVKVDDGLNFVLIWNEEKKAHLPLFTDIEEFEKMFKDYNEDVFPHAFYFKDLLKVAKDDFVINPASESVVITPDILKN